MFVKRNEACAEDAQVRILLNTYAYRIYIQLFFIDLIQKMAKLASELDIFDIARDQLIKLRSIWCQTSIYMKNN